MSRLFTVEVYEDKTLKTPPIEGPYTFRTVNGATAKITEIRASKAGGWICLAKRDEWGRTEWRVIVPPPGVPGPLDFK